ncbi:MAG: hypothetical protein Kow0056_16700 [Coriobacteriia bacterium]
MAEEYLPLGLIGNPFDLEERQRRYGAAWGLAMRAMVHKVLTELYLQGHSDSSKPIIIEKPSSFSTTWHLRTTTAFLRAATSNLETGVLVIYVPLELFRLGRIRGALSAAAERVAFMRILDNLASLARESLTTPDSTLPEWAPLEAAVDVGQLLERLDANPHGVVEEVLGESTMQRDETVDPKRFMHLLGLRQGRLDPDPQETDDAEEFDSEDPYKDAFTSPGADMYLARPDGSPAEAGDGEGGDEALTDDGRAEDASDSESEEPESETARLIGDYWIAYAKKHLSPVLARGLLAYRAQGVGAMLSEWKITKAPKKTLKALLRFACRSYDKVALVFDHFEHLLLMPDDVREVILSTLTELRLSTREYAFPVMMRIEGDPPELDTLFGDAVHIVWDYPGAERIEENPVAWGEDDVRFWLESAAIRERRVVDARSEGVQRIMAASEKDLGRFADMMAEALRDAAARGANGLDEQAVDAGLRVSIPEQE